jgi:hypothetical protein
MASAIQPVWCFRQTAYSSLHVDTHGQRVVAFFECPTATD